MIPKSSTADHGITFSEHATNRLMYQLRSGRRLEAEETTCIDAICSSRGRLKSSSHDLGQLLFEFARQPNLQLRAEIRRKE